MPHELLVLSFLENVLLNDSIYENLQFIRNMGFKLAVDNFTVDVSLNESSKYKNIQFVKLNRTIISTLLMDQYSKIMLREFVNMLTSIGKVVVIEGVENDDEVKVIEEINDGLKEDLFYTLPHTIISIEDMKDEEKRHYD